MKRKILIILLMIFTVGSIFSVTILITHDMYQNKIAQNYSTEASADWPVYDIDQLISDKSDLVVFATVEDIRDKEDIGDENHDSIRAKISTLQVDEIVYSGTSSIPRTIELDQALNYVEPGKSYLLFLKKNGDYYYEVDGNSLIPEIDSMYKVDIPGIKGTYSKNQISMQIENKIK